jgi:Ca2+-binding RTX toxin-like protein
VVRGRIQDKDGGFTDYLTTIHVNNVAPTAAILGAPASSVEGSPISLSSSVSDPGAADTFTYAWTVLKDGAAFAAGSEASFSFLADDNGTYAITLTVTDKDGGTTTASVNVTVVDAAPTVGISGPNSGTSGQPLDYSLMATDAAAVDEAAGFHYAIDWGDGTVDMVSGTGGSTPVRHAFGRAGSYTVRVTATDKDGSASNPASLTVQVTQATGASLVPNPFDPNKTDLLVVGTPGNDEIVIRPGETAGSVRVILNGQLLGTYQPTGRIVARGEAGDDVLRVAGGVALPAWLDGEAGNDFLKGGRGNDVLVGGPGRDWLVGGRGRDVLVADADDIVGWRGANDLVLFRSGADPRDTAFAAVVAEWTGRRGTRSPEPADIFDAVLALSGRARSPSLV